MRALNSPLYSLAFGEEKKHKYLYSAFYEIIVGPILPLRFIYILMHPVVIIINLHSSFNAEDQVLHP
jgi:hypothetical protein